MSSGHKLSTEEEERTEIFLVHIAKNTMLGIDGRLHDVTRPTVTVMKSGFIIEALLLLDA
jgi:hypothetical protein